MSYAKVDADKAYNAAKRHLMEIRAYVEKEREPYIIREMKPKFFGLIKGKSRDEAIATLKKLPPFSGYQLCGLYGLIEREDCTRIMAMAELSQDGFVNLDPKDCELLVNYYY
jgi:hypothetical protein